MSNWISNVCFSDLSDDYADLLATRADLPIRITADPGPGLAAHRLATNRRVLCAAPDYLARFGVPETVPDLRRHRLPAADGQLPWRLIGPKGAATVAGESHVRPQSSELGREQALSGVGLAVRSPKPGKGAGEEKGG